VQRIVSPRKKGLLRAAGYFLVAVVIAFVAPAMSRAGRRGGAWAGDTVRDAGSPWADWIRDILGLEHQQHHGDRTDVLDELIRAGLSAVGQRGD
jgi:hypothetical protein